MYDIGFAAFEEGVYLLLFCLVYYGNNIVMHISTLSLFPQEYLSSLGVLHRDLACRNILVDEGKLLKISDFGLSRDTPEYVSSLQDKMPLRWMAPETVTENVFTDKSDV